MRLVILVFLLFDASFALSIDLDPKCLDEEGNPLDWFALYKFPKESESPREKNDSFIEQGLGNSKEITVDRPFLQTRANCNR